jgi:hypothetical protein
MPGAEGCGQKLEVLNQLTFAICALSFAYLASSVWVALLQESLYKISHELSKDDCKIILPDEASDISVLGNPLMG